MRNTPIHCKIIIWLWDGRVCSLHANHRPLYQQSDPHNVYFYRCHFGFIPRIKSILLCTQHTLFENNSCIIIIQWVILYIYYTSLIMW